MEAELDGLQRKMVMSGIRPVRRAHGAEGISLRGGKTLPFVVRRSWSAPAGHYYEQWYLVDPETREVLREGPLHLVQLWGLQAPTELADEVTDPIELEPGTYLVVFALGGVKGGEMEVDAVELSSEEAA